ncbi:MAG: bifunctional phosphopantothenoylcysteine decarboxylase/phosphopantothenate--cysteine ligase CoaBC, partial [Flavobacteriales bacterium]|nr:bifunctional phosphopantothenoylcysteine decarboxylase/phosphopantothenate--cysteine ligase CoaBC [Flavobacteriales bacterium]
MVSAIFFYFHEVLENKKIVLAITGSIAAYKAAFLVRLLVREGADVRVVLSPGALEFVTPLTLATLSNHPIHSDFTEDKAQGTWTNHVEMGLWGDLMIVAPCTANTLSKMVSGQCDNFLMAVYLSAKCQVMIAPAMDLDMFAHASTQDNLNTLRSRNAIILDAESGKLASGLEGKGRMMEPESILEHVIAYFHPKRRLVGKTVLITAGPTHEPLDPVRFIGNRSTGKMGMAIAEAAIDRGARVTVVAGPTVT